MGGAQRYCGGNSVVKALEGVVNLANPPPIEKEVTVACFADSTTNKLMSISAQKGFVNTRDCADKVMPKLAEILGSSVSDVTAAYSHALRLIAEGASSSSMFECAETASGKPAEYIEDGGFFKIRLDSSHQWASNQDESPKFVHEYFHVIVATAYKERDCKAESAKEVAAICLRTMPRAQEEKLVQSLTDLCGGVHKLVTEVDIYWDE